MVPALGRRDLTAGRAGDKHTAPSVAFVHGMSEEVQDTGLQMLPIVV